MLTKNELCMESYQYMSSNNNKNSVFNASQPIILPWKVHFELANRTTNTVFSIYKGQELSFLTTLNVGVEELKVRYTKT